ncbi:MAG: winged helix-turn-helix transcriptional regulator [Magnetococcales bacterium]|nr:winged helix-turn-helix transcriptional regulator [Magnetococcales bacterium]
MPETRWIDRIVCEDNIIQAWEQLLSKYRFFTPKPFRDIDPVTLGRRDDPPGFRVFREAAVNLLIHQDYGDHSRKAVIKFFRDGIHLWNPGDVFGDDSRLWEPGEKEVRNPSIAMAMRRIAMCEQAGTGLRMMREAWRKLGHPSPTYKNDRAGKAFELFIPELDKEVDMASNLVKAMFGGAQTTRTPVIAKGDQADEDTQAKERTDSLKVALKTSVKATLETASAIMDAMARDSGITVPEIAKMLSVSTRTIHNHIQKLKNAGLIRRIGPDKGGHWKI